MYINGTGARDTSLQYNLFDLPHSESLKRKISRYQKLVGIKIKDVAEYEIDLALAIEVKATVFLEKGGGWYDEWLKKLVAER